MSHVSQPVQKEMNNVRQLYTRKFVFVHDTYVAGGFKSKNMLKWWTTCLFRAYNLGLLGVWVIVLLLGVRV